MPQNLLTNTRTQIEILEFCSEAKSGKKIIDAIENEKSGRIRMFLSALSIAGYLQALGNTRGRTYHTTQAGRDHVAEQRRKLARFEKAGL